MQFQKKEKRQTTVRFDSHHVRLRTGEIQRKTGSYMYRWTDKLGKRNTIYAATLEDLREQEEQILVDQHDGIKANIKNVTVNDVYELWCQLKRGIKDSTMKNYIYMYELFVKPTFGKKKLVQVKKSDVRRFYNQLIDDIPLYPGTGQRYGAYGRIRKADCPVQRGMIVERTQTGKAVARQDPNFRDGRPKKYSPEQIQLALELLEQGKTYRQVT